MSCLDTESRRPVSNTGQSACLTILRQQSLLSQNINLFLPWSIYILLTKREGRTGRISARARLVNKRFITRLKKAKTAKTQVRDHSGQYPVRYLENIGPAIEHFDWLILVIGPLTA